MTEVTPSVIKTARVRSRRTEAALSRYEPRLQPRVRALADGHPYLADLALSFPALLFALAIPRRGFDPKPAISQVIAGNRLADIAAIAGVPMWLRTLRPQAFENPLGTLPGSPAFARAIPARIPRAAKQVRWLEAVERAYVIANEDVALWMAGEVARRPVFARRIRRQRALCLWAWYSHKPGTLGHSLLDRIWSPAIKFENTEGSVRSWIERIEAKSYIGLTRYEEPWCTQTVVDGYEFVPVLTAEALAEEARAMQNCILGAAYRLGSSGGNIWSVRRNGARVANLELSRGCCNTPLLQEASGPSNANLSDELAGTIASWFRTHQQPLPTRLEKKGISPETWRELWRPYWLEKRRIPDWLPFHPSESALARLLYPGRD